MVLTLMKIFVHQLFNIEKIHQNVGSSALGVNYLIL